MRLTFNSRYYSDAGEFVTREESRYALLSIRCEPHPEIGVVLVATDGHTMCVFHDKGGTIEGEGFTLRFEESFAKLCGEKFICQLNDDDSLSLIKGRESVRFANMLESKPFPSWRAVLPACKPDAQRNDYNPSYLERCGKVSNAPWPHVAIWSGSDGSQVTHGEESPAVVCVTDREDAFFLVMPMRQTSEVKYPSALMDALRPKG